MNTDLLEATKHLMDLKMEKKAYLKDQNLAIKAAEEEIKRLVNESDQ